MLSCTVIIISLNRKRIVSERWQGQTEKFFLEQLQETILEKANQQVGSRRTTKEVIKFTTKNKIGDKMTLGTKSLLILLLCMIFM